MPFYIKAPGVTQPGSTCATPVIHIDFYPTLLALADIQKAPPQPLDGVSLLPLLEGARSATAHFSGTILTMATRVANLRRSFVRMAGNWSIIGRTTATNSTIWPTTSANKMTLPNGRRRGPPNCGRNFRSG